MTPRQNGPMKLDDYRAMETEMLGRLHRLMEDPASTPGQAAAIGVVLEHVRARMDAISAWANKKRAEESR